MLKRLKAGNPDLKGTTEEQMKSSVRLYDTDFLIRRSRRKLSPKNSCNADIRLRCAVSNGSSLNTAFKKKLHTCHPGKPPIKIETHRTKQKVRLELCDSQSIERGVRQLLPDKLTAEGIQPTIPWLYDFKLDFRFK